MRDKATRDIECLFDDFMDVFNSRLETLCTSFKQKMAKVAKATKREASAEFADSDAGGKSPKKQRKAPSSINPWSAGELESSMYD